MSLTQREIRQRRQELRPRQRRNLTDALARLLRGESLRSVLSPTAVVFARTLRRTVGLLRGDHLEADQPAVRSLHRRMNGRQVARGR